MHGARDGAVGRDSGDPFVYLADEHRTIIRLMEQLRSSASTARNAAEIGRELQAAFLRHADAEEGALYPLLERIQSLRDRTLELYGEHHMLKLTFEELALMEPGSEEWRTKLDALSTTLAQHFANEERGIYTEARAALGAARVRALAESLRARWPGV